MLGTTFLGQRYDLKLKKSTSAILSTTATISGSISRSSTIPDSLTIEGSSTTTSSLEREVSTFSSDHPSFRSHEDHSTSTTSSSFGCPIGYSNHTNTKNTTSGNSVSASFQHPKIIYSGDSTLEEDIHHLADALNTARAQICISGSSTSGESSEETGANLRVQEQNRTLLFHRSIPNGDHHDGRPFTSGNRFRRSNSTVGFSDFLGSSLGDHDEDERYPDYTSSAGSLDEEDMDAVVPEATIVSTNASGGDWNSSTRSRRSSNTTSSPISPVVFRSRSSILEHVVVSRNNDQAEPSIRVVSRWEGPSREGDMNTTSPVLPSVQTVEKTAWWRNISASYLCAPRWQEEIEPQGGDPHGASMPAVQERRTLIGDRLTARTEFQTTKPLPAPPPTSVDDESLQSYPHKTLLSVIFPCLPIAIASGKQRSNESEKCSVKPSDHPDHASRAQNTICGRIAMRFKNRRRGCIPCTEDIGTEVGQRRHTDVLEVRVEREISRTIS